MTATKHLAMDCTDCLLFSHNFSFAQEASIAESEGYTIVCGGNWSWWRIKSWKRWQKWIEPTLFSRRPNEVFWVFFPLSVLKTSNAQVWKSNDHKCGLNRGMLLSTVVVMQLGVEAWDQPLGYAFQAVWMEVDLPEARETNVIIR